MNRPEDSPGQAELVPPEVSAPDVIEVDATPAEDPASLDTGEVLLMTARRYRGPLPHPELLEGYERAVPGSAETILNQFVAEGRHRHGIENRIVDSNIKHEGRSQFLGAGLSALGIIASVVMALYDQPVVAAITFVVNFGSLVTIYFVGSRVTEPEPPTPPSTPAPPAEGQDQ